VAEADEATPSKGLAMVSGHCCKPKIRKSFFANVGARRPVYAKFRDISINTAVLRMRKHCGGNFEQAKTSS
jgi:hypothetical protein